MDSKTEANLIRQLIADNQNKQAAERLHQWFEGKSASRQDAALGLLNRVTSLNDNVLRGLISQADADLERNRITQSLLDLAKQLDDTDTLPMTGKGFPAKPLLAIGIVLHNLEFAAIFYPCRVHWQFCRYGDISFWQRQQQLAVVLSSGEGVAAVFGIPLAFAVDEFLSRLAGHKARLNHIPVAVNNVVILRTVLDNFRATQL